MGKNDRIILNISSSSERDRSALEKSVALGRLIEGSELMRRLSLLHEIQLHIDTAQNREDIFACLRNEVKWLTEFDVCFMGLLNRSNTHYVINIISSNTDINDINHKHFALDEGDLGWVIRNRTAMIEDLTSQTVAGSNSLDSRLRSVGINSLLVVPMRIEKEVIGALAFG